MASSYSKCSLQTLNVYYRSWLVLEALGNKVMSIVDDKTALC